MPDGVLADHASVTSLSGRVDTSIGRVHLKGTVSKHVQRMVDGGFVERSPVPGNRKEIRLRLTPDGRALERVHRRMHEEMSDGLRQFLLRYTATELQTVTKVLEDLLKADKLGVSGKGR